jgi:IclR family transcriptional regulator, KDG regulon repressor
MVKREKANYMIQSVSHAIDVLEELAKAGGEVGVTELSKRLKLHKNNVFRLLATLELRGYVEQNMETEDYRLGVRALQLGQAYLMQSELVGKSKPILRRLAETIGETVSFATLQNGQVQYPVTVESKRPVKVAPRIGVAFSAKHCASGRLLTAQLPDVALEEILSGATPQDVAIKNQLVDLRNAGSIIDRGATEADVVTVARVVRGPTGAVVGAVEVLIPQYRAKIEDVMPLIDEAVAALSNQLGSPRSGLAAEVTKEVIGSEELAMGVLSPGIQAIGLQK